MDLYYREFGSGEPLMIVHGLFGSSDNWLSIGRKLSASRRVLLLDQRNHGRSGRSARFDLEILGEDIKDLVVSLGADRIDLIGHSLGGKAVMTFGLKYPELLNRLIVVDIAPKAYTIHHEDLVDAMLSLDLPTLKDRRDADQLLQQSITNQSIRQFLLKNLVKKEDGTYQWLLNLPVIKAQLPGISHAVQASKSIDNLTLFIRGTRSHYIEIPGDLDLINRLFPKSRIVDIEAGHWLHSEKPLEFVEAVEHFLN